MSTHSELGVVCSEVFLSKVVRSHWVDLGGEDGQLRKLAHDSLSGLGRTEEVDQNHMLFRHLE